MLTAEAFECYLFFMSNLHMQQGITVYQRILSLYRKDRNTVYQRIPRVYQAVCKEVSAYTKKDSPVYQPYTKRKISRIPSVYRAQVIARRGRIPIVYQLVVYHHLCHSALFAGFGNSSKQSDLEAMVYKAIWYEAPNDVPLSFEHVLLELMIRF